MILKLKWRTKIMKLSEHTTSILKNYATINQNLVIKEGSELLTMSANSYQLKGRNLRL